MLTQRGLCCWASRAVWGMHAALQMIACTRQPWSDVLAVHIMFVMVRAGATKILSMLDRQEELGSVASEVSSPTAKASNQYPSPAACRLPVS
jgi:hypothetical protein